MKNTKLALAIGICALLGTATTAHAQETNDSYMLEITKVGVKIGHDMKFRESVKGYHECLMANDYSGSWSAWSNVGGEGRSYHFVSRMANWAELDSTDEASKTCWAEHHDSITGHVESIETRYARSMPDWSGSAEGFKVVRLHQFRVDDTGDFRSAVAAITGVLKDSDYAHLGSWYQMLGSDSTEFDYFVVAHYENFAAMDEDRGVYDAVVKAVGQERADEMWEAFGDALRDDWEYFTELLRHEEDLSHSEED